MSATRSDTGGDAGGAMWYPRPPTPPARPRTPSLRRPQTAGRVTAAGATAELPWRQGDRRAPVEEPAKSAQKSLAFNFEALCDVVGNKASQRYRSVAQAQLAVNRSRNDTVNHAEIHNFFQQLSLPREYADCFWKHLIQSSESPAEIDASVLWKILGPYVLPGYGDYGRPQTANPASRGPERPSSAFKHKHKTEVEQLQDLIGRKIQVPSARSSSRPSSARSARPSSARGVHGGPSGLRAARAAAAQPKARTSSSLAPNLAVVLEQAAGPSRPRQAPQAPPRPGSASKIQNTSWDAASLASVSTQASSIAAGPPHSGRILPPYGAGDGGPSAGEAGGASTPDRLQRAEAYLAPRGLTCFIGKAPANPVSTPTYDSSNFWSQLGSSDHSDPALERGKMSRSWGPSARQSLGEEPTARAATDPTLHERIGRNNKASPRWCEDDYARAEEKYALNLSEPDHYAGWRVHVRNTKGDVHNECVDHMGSVVIQPGHHERSTKVYLRDNPARDALARLRAPYTGIRRARSAPGGLRRHKSVGRSAAVMSPRPAPEPPPSPDLSGISDAHHDDHASGQDTPRGRAVYYTDHRGQVALDMCQTGGASVRSSMNGSR